MDERSATNESTGGFDEMPNANATNANATNDVFDVNDELLGTLAEVED